MPPFIHDDFLLQTKSARSLFHGYAETEPILDYHCHLSPKEIAENRQFANLYEIWLEGDHYKWRAMRADGVDERLITGNATPREKFMAWARTVPKTLRNPLFHWTHLELKRYFGIDELLNEETAAAIWDQTCEMLRGSELSAHGILKKFNVHALCTTDDPAEDLHWHRSIAQSGLETRVYPAFRPDKALLVDQPKVFNTWIDKLQLVSGVKVTSLSSFLEALEQRHQAFHDMGARLSDHGINHCYAISSSQQTAQGIFDRARLGHAATREEHEQFASYLMFFFGQLDAAKGWTKQLHVGALRNANSRMRKLLGPDTGYDSIGDWPQIDALKNYLDALDAEDSLPRTIVYNLNPTDNYAVATMMGNFQDGRIAGKMQFGSGWWFLDQKEAIEWQLNALSNCGLLSRFVGMLTDSRSFMSYPRHEYFRRVLCNLLGDDIEKGELPSDLDLAGGLVRDICYRNIRDYLGLELAPTDRMIAA